MYPDWVGSALAGFLIIWLLVLSLLIWQQRNFLKSLFPKSGSRDIRKKFEESIRSVEGFRGKLSDLEDSLGIIKDEGLGHIQRVELLRFNPYNDTGGDQSFVVCLLNDKGSGIVVTSLHARSETRIFAKDVILGKSKYQLSTEEELVIKKAMERE